jgi:hypothetical protein
MKAVQQQASTHSPYLEVLNKETSGPKHWQKLSEQTFDVYNGMKTMMGWMGKELES